jgi:hypothetical protein
MSSKELNLFFSPLRISELLKIQGQTNITIGENAIYRLGRMTFYFENLLYNNSVDMKRLFYIYYDLACEKN